MSQSGRRSANASSGSVRAPVRRRSLARPTLTPWEARRYCPAVHRPSCGDLVRADQGRGTMKKLGLVAALLGIAFAAPTPAVAQVKGVYWASSGFFGPFNIQGLIPTVPKEKSRDVTIPISMWIIDHPKGLVVYDTGNNIRDLRRQVQESLGRRQLRLPQTQPETRGCHRQPAEEARIHARAGEGRDHLARPSGSLRQHQDVPQGRSRHPEEGALPGVVAGEVPAGRRRVRDGRLRRPRARLQLPRARGDYDLFGDGSSPS